MITLLAAQALSAPLGRGLWMHYHDGDPLGTSSIVGNPAAESLALARIDLWGVDRVYGGYQELPVTDRAQVAAWNQQLASAGVESQLLLGSPDHIFPGVACRGELLDQIDARLRDFNLGSPTLSADERFVALHLDIEPHQYKPGYVASPPGCADPALYWDPSTRAELFALLYDTYVDVRAHLDGNGLAHIPIYADLPYWVDTSTAFDWSSVPFTNGIDWTADAAGVIDGFTYMTYENADAMDIREDILGERMLLLSATPIRPALNARERAAFSSILTWTWQSELFAVADALHAGTGLFAYPVDLHNYRYLASPWPLEPLVATPVALSAVVSIVEPAHGKAVVDTGPERLRSARLAAKLDRLEAVIDGSECTSPLDELYAGRMRLPGGDGWSIDGSGAASLFARDGQISGTLGSLPLDPDTSAFRADGRAFAPTQDGFAVGWFVRVNGHRGIWFAGVAHCAPDVDVEALGASWLE